MTRIIDSTTYKNPIQKYAHVEELNFDDRGVWKEVGRRNL